MEPTKEYLLQMDGKIHQLVVVIKQLSNVISAVGTPKILELFQQQQQLLFSKIEEIKKRLIGMEGIVSEEDEPLRKNVLEKIGEFEEVNREIVVKLKSMKPSSDDE